MFLESLIGIFVNGWLEFESCGNFFDTMDPLALLMSLFCCVDLFPFRLREGSESIL